MGAEKFREGLGRGERVAAVATVFRAGECGFNGGEMRVRNVTFRVKPRAARVVHEVVATIENDPRRIVEVRGEFGGADQHAVNVTDSLRAGKFERAGLA